jgi:hypothetical protein
MVLVLADVKPLTARAVGRPCALSQPWIHACMHPVARVPPRAWRALTDPAHELDHAVPRQHSLELVDLGLIDCRLGQHHDVDVVDLVQSRDEHTIHEIQVEPLGRGELEESERVVLQPLHRSLQGTEVGLADPQRPRQQQQVNVLRPRIGPQVARLQLVPGGFEPGSLHTHVARERGAAGRRCTHLGQDPHAPRRNSRQRSRPGQQLPGSSAIQGAPVRSRARWRCQARRTPRQQSHAATAAPYKPANRDPPPDRPSAGPRPPARHPIPRPACSAHNRRDPRPTRTTPGPPPPPHRTSHQRRRVASAPPPVATRRIGTPPSDRAAHW